MKSRSRDFQTPTASTWLVEALDRASRSDAADNERKGKCPCGGGCRSLARALEGPTLRTPTVAETSSCGAMPRPSRTGEILMRKQASLAAATVQSEGQIARIIAAPPGDSSSTVLELVERVALDPRADVEKLDRMMT